jgi:hypothetical protein
MFRYVVTDKEGRGTHSSSFVVVRRLSSAEHTCSSHLVLSADVRAS